MAPPRRLPARPCTSIRPFPVPQRVGVLLLAALSFLAALGAGRARAQEYRLDDRAEPLAQSVRLKLDPARSNYSGTTVTDLRLRRPTDALVFHAEDMELDRVELRRRDPEGGSAGGSRGPWSLAVEVGRWGTVTARAGETLAPGRYVLEVDFRQELNTRGVALYRTEHEGEPYLFTQFQVDDAREAFPCWDEPEYKISYELTLEVPIGLGALTNTPIAHDSESDGIRTVVFEPTPPIPSYLLALAVGPLETVEIAGLSAPGRVVTTRGRSGLTDLAVEMTPSILAQLELYFGSPYPYAKLDLIAVPEFWHRAMENPGAITFAESVLLLDSARASVAQRRTLARVLAHELAHIWFGDLVTMRWWNDLWLNESFAEWMGGKIVAEIHPELETGIWSRLAVENAMIGDARPSSSAIRKTVDSRGDMEEDLGLAYTKGSEILGMVERWIGPQAFREGVERYLREHAWGNAEAEDLWSALSDVSGRDVRPVLESFVAQPGVPLIKVAFEDTGGGPRLVLEQERFHPVGAEVAPQLWTVPVHLKIGTGSGVVDLSVLLDRPRLEVPLDGRPDWLMPNSGASGYYRWQLPEEMLLDLAWTAERRMDPVERAAFLGNAGGLLDAALLDGGDYLQILEAFAEDSEPQVIEAVLGGLDRVQLAFVPDDLLPIFRRYLRSTLGPVLERHGVEPRPAENETISLLRPRLIAWLGWARDEEVVRFARSRAERYLEDPGSVDPGIAGTVLRIAARHGDEALFETIRKRYETAGNPADRQDLLRSLGSFEVPELRRRALGYALEGPLHATEIFTIPLAQRHTADDRDRILRWAMDHFDDLAERVPQPVLDYLPQAASGCSLARLRTAEEFFAEDSRSTEGLAKNLAKVRSQVRDCVVLREREGVAVRRYLSTGA